MKDPKEARDTRACSQWKEEDLPWSPTVYNNPSLGQCLGPYVARLCDAHGRTRCLKKSTTHHPLSDGSVGFFAYAGTIEGTVKNRLGVCGVKSDLLISRDVRTRLDACIVVRGRRET